MLKYIEKMINGAALVFLFCIVLYKELTKRYDIESDWQQYFKCY